MSSTAPSLAPNSSEILSLDPLGDHSVWEVILIVLTTGILSLVTIIGNLLVLLAFKLNSDLKTVNNYFLLSLACADLIIGVISMNLYTTYIIMGRWMLGSVLCDLWLALDYVASNASVMNLLIICFDRYFSITRPLTYRAKRTPKRAAIMIGLAWAISFIVWAPAILFWQYIEGERTVSAGKCYIQFFEVPTITFGTAIAAFYLPVTIMIILYWRIYRETENRARELAGLQGSETKTIIKPAPSSTKSSSSSSEQSQQVETHTVVVLQKREKACCFPNWKQGPPALKSYLDHSNGSLSNTEEGELPDSLTSSEGEDQAFEMKSICSVVIKLPMINSVVQPPAMTATSALNENAPKHVQGDMANSSNTEKNRSGKAPMDMNSAKVIKRLPKHKSLPLNSTAIKGKSAATKNQISKRKSLSLIKEKKAAKTLSAILLAFILTWTPYNIMVLVSTFCKDCVPARLWELGYWLCYVNSTVNPMCYALCNKSFRTTFKMLLVCQWDKRKWKSHKHPILFFRTPSH
ncbi:muscarinic acetylcholine receptor M1 [Microcaecilia unicolor]|uniref:Muscarinic acetylcholine receptor n=1 Tax=Microcaecilia unicolor TaxID=1415580 RepID=A0A6P7ZAY6_9AMPH|nr:muscarinic acetylcholine receptor M1 [Microcaecilia unicolor]XP_030074774.1 muscarinic acetylcholine receptor M1 [Microcaecilia unicolor]XP_030074776.1 muscarinic acetylcholine receptor M1 [Microcaecilia unicolor]